MTGPLYPPFYPPAYPAAPVTIVAEQLTANGLNLNSPWCQVESLSGLMVGHARRGENPVVPGRHGVLHLPRKRYDVTEVTLPLLVRGVQPTTGEVPSNALTRLYRNLDELLRTFSDDPVELRYTRQDGTVRAAATELTLEPLVMTRERSSPPVARVGLELALLNGMWFEPVDAAQTITGVTGTTTNLSLFAGSTAPVADARITFFGPVSNPRLAVGDRWVQYNGVVAAGRELVLECGHWRASAGAGAAWSPDERQVYREPGPSWFEVPPSRTPLTATFIHTGGGSASVEIAGHRKFLTI